MPQFAELIRYTVVVCLGLAVDLGVALVVHQGLGVPLIGASALGLLAGAAANYLCHEFWTFRRAGAGVNAGRIARFGLALGITLAVRMAAVAGLSQLIWLAQQDLVILTLAAGLSFVVNFVISKRFVFTAEQSAKDAPDGVSM